MSSLPLFVTRKKKKKPEEEGKTVSHTETTQPTRKGKMEKTEGLLLDWHSLVCDTVMIVSTPLSGNRVNGKVLNKSGTNPQIGL